VELPHLRQGVFECLGGSCARQWVEILVCCHGEGLEDGSIIGGSGERDWGVDRVTSNRTMRTVRIVDTALLFGPTPLSTPLLLVSCFHRDLHNAVQSPFRGHDFQKGSVRASLVKEAATVHQIASVQDKHKTEYSTQHNEYSTPPSATQFSFPITSILTIFVENSLRPCIPPAYQQKPNYSRTDTPTGLE
jgi:hypothetical protein